MALARCGYRPEGAFSVEAVHAPDRAARILLPAVAAVFGAALLLVGECEQYGAVPGGELGEASPKRCPVSGRVQREVLCGEGVSVRQCPVPVAGGGGVCDQGGDEWVETLVRGFGIGAQGAVG